MSGAAKRNEIIGKIQHTKILMEHTLRTMAAVVAASAVACLPSCHSNERSAQTDAPQVDVASVIEDSVVIYKDYPGTLTAVNSVDVVGRVNCGRRTIPTEARSARVLCCLPSRIRNIATP